MAERVSIELFGDEHFRRRIIATRYRARNMSPVLGDIGRDFQDIIKHQFDTEGARSRRPWKQLTDFTVMRRGSAHPILRDSGAMYAELIDPMNLFVDDNSVAIILSPHEEAKAESHQHGYHNAMTGRDVPARPIVDFTWVDRGRFQRKITRYLVDGDIGRILP
jgi:hypothetical protein